MSSGLARTRSRARAPIFAVAVGAMLLAAGCAQPVPRVWDGLEKPCYSRVTLMPDGPKLYSARYSPASGARVGIRPGSAAKVTFVADLYFEVTVDKIPYKLYPVGEKFNTAEVAALVEKYFVEDASLVGLETMPDSIKGNVVNGVAAVGMTKEQVYIAIGPPAEVNFGQSAVNMPRDTIMQQNRWVYYSNSFTPWWFQQVYTFAEDTLATVEQ